MSTPLPDELQRRISALERELIALKKINEALMNRVERTIDSAGTAFSLFETNILLQQRVNDRTLDLEHSNRLLHQEVLERKDAEKRLRELQRNTRLIIDNALDAVVIFDANGNIRDWNPRAETTLGYETEHAIGGLTLDKLLTPHAREKISTSLAQLGNPDGQSPHSTHFESVALHRDGHEFPVEVSVSLIPTANETVYAAFISDITERKRVEEARYQTLFENSPISLWEKDLSAVKAMVDQLHANHVADLPAHLHEYPEIAAEMMAAMRIVDINQATLKLFKVESKEQLIREIGSVFDQAAVDLFVGELISLTNGRREHVSEIRTRAWTGEAIDVIVSMTLAPGCEDSWSKVFVSLIDITDRRRAEEERARLEARLRHTQKLETIGTLAGGIAHDFNNILSPILGHTRMILDSAEPSPDTREALQQVNTAANRARDLVRQILTFSRRMEHERVPLNLNHIVREALDLIRASLPATVAVEQEIRCDARLVLADATQIHQVVMNLCTNAYHALSNQAGTIRVSLENTEVAQDMVTVCPALHTGPHVKLTVTDNGCGMDRATLERIFEPFFTTKDVGQGTGMGLSVAHGIVSDHGGEIVVSSETGVGSTFSVYLPAAEIAPETPDGVECEPAVSGSGEIMVIDDEPMVADMTCKILELLGYQVTSFNSSVKALAAFKESPERFAAVVTDQTMPGLTGTQLAQELLRLRPGLPIVLLSGFSETVTEDNFRLFGISEYVAKPCGMAEISHAVGRALGQSVCA